MLFWTLSSFGAAEDMKNEMEKRVPEGEKEPEGGAGNAGRE